MSHFLAARLSAAAHRGRIAASLVGLLALIVALFAVTATAGARTHTPTGHAAKQHAAKHDGGKAGDKAGKEAGKAGDKAPGKDENDNKP
ncbi:MAG: hypothetical protein QOH46_2251, partial [Solirubrobacteraceae bacterium]|nr:hypothetical protein [Solirubrobacteraceae bacterium]